MAKKPAKKTAKTLGKKQMKKTAGGFTGFAGGVQVAAGDVNGDNVAFKRTFTGGV